MVMAELAQLSWELRHIVSLLVCMLVCMVGLRNISQYSLIVLRETQRNNSLSPLFPDLSLVAVLLRRKIHFEIQRVKTTAVGYKNTAKAMTAGRDKANPVPETPTHRRPAHRIGASLRNDGFEKDEQ